MIDQKGPAIALKGELTVESKLTCASPARLPRRSTSNFTDLKLHMILDRRRGCHGPRGTSACCAALNIVLRPETQTILKLKRFAAALLEDGCDIGCCFPVLSPVGSRLCFFKPSSSSFFNLGPSFPQVPQVPGYWGGDRQNTQFK